MLLKNDLMRWWTFFLNKVKKKTTKTSKIKRSLSDIKRNLYSVLMNLNLNMT